MYKPLVFGESHVVIVIIRSLSTLESVFILIPFKCVVFSPLVDYHTVVIHGVWRFVVRVIFVQLRGGVSAFTWYIRLTNGVVKRNQRRASSTSTTTFQLSSARTSSGTYNRHLHHILLTDAAYNCRERRVRTWKLAQT